MTDKAKCSRCGNSELFLTLTHKTNFSLPDIRVCLLCQNYVGIAGYTTEFSLSILKGKTTVPSCDHATTTPSPKNRFCSECGTMINTLSIIDKITECLLSKPKGYNPFIAKCNWYKHEADMKTFSKMYPDSVFVLLVNKTDSLESFKKYFYRGMMQKEMAHIEYNAFDEYELK
jgi:ribosomal protein S27AE